LEIENKPYVELMAEWGEEEDYNNVRYFMEDSNKSSPFQVDEVTKFCSGWSPESLERNTGNQDSVAWLDDRSSECGEVRSRIHQNPLTPSGLYKELKKKVRTVPFYLNVGRLNRALTLFVEISDYADS
jgi:hypothetical protein